MQLARRLSRDVLVFIGELSRLFQDIVRHYVARLDPAFSLHFVLSPDAVPTLFLGVITGVGNVDRVENVDRIAAVNLE